MIDKVYCSYLHNVKILKREKKCLVKARKGLFHKNHPNTIRYSATHSHHTLQIGANF